MGNITGYFTDITIGSAVDIVIHNFMGNITGYFIDITIGSAIDIVTCIAIHFYISLLFWSSVVNSVV